MYRLTRWWTSRVLALASILLATAQGGCELSDDDCGPAKAHLCEKLAQQACSAAWMGDAVDRLRDGCPDGETDRFVMAAESYCRSASEFSASDCADR